MSKFDFTIKNETPEQFEESLKQIKNDIKLEFLNMARNKRKGFFISLPMGLTWLGIEYENDKRFRDNFKRKFLTSDAYNIKEAKSETDYGADFIYRKNEEGDIRIQIPWFSDRGFKKLCQCMDKSPKASLVRDYFLEIEQDYVESLEMKIDEFEKHREVILKQVKEFKERYDTLEQKSARQSEMFYELSNKNNKLKIKLQMANEDARHYYEFKNIFKLIEDFNDADETIATRLGLQVYQATFGKPVIVSVVSDQFINEILAKELIKKTKPRTGAKKKQIKIKNESEYSSDECNDNIIADISSDEDGPESHKEITIDNYKCHYKLPDYNTDFDTEFADMSSAWIKQYISGLDLGSNYDIEHQLYFTLSKPGSKTATEPNKKIIWDTLYFFNNNHYNLFEQSIADLRLGSQIKELKAKNIKNIYKAPYVAILNLHKQLLGKIALKTIRESDTNQRSRASTVKSDKKIIDMTNLITELVINTITTEGNNTLHQDICA